MDISPEAPDWVRSAQKLTRSLRQIGSEALESPGHTMTTYGDDEYFELAYADGTRFVIDGDTKRLWAACPPQHSLGLLELYLQGPVMGFVLRRRGITALHASAMCINGLAVLLCGPSEAGKSTTSAAMALRGLPVLCDDITVIAEDETGFQAQPGCVRVCLWPEAVRGLFGRQDALPRLVENWEKRFLPLDGTRAKFHAEKCPLGAIYLLASRRENAHLPQIEAVSSRQALLELVQNTYMNWLLDRKQRAAEFAFLSRLVGRAPVRRISPHSDPTEIGALCELIVADMRRL